MTRSHFWHPFSNLAATREREVVFARGMGSTLIDVEGREYLDATASLWYCAVGHGRPEIAAAIGAQAARLEACSCFDVYASDVTIELADRLAAMAPVRDASVFLTSGGSDSIDSAAKIARRHFALQGVPERTVMIAREGSYHGTHAYGTSLGGITPNRDGWGALVDEVIHVPAFDLVALERAIKLAGPERVAGFFAEPVLGAGGVFPPPPGYLPAAAEICRRYGVLLIADEVVTGLGRTGSWFACERYGVEPDLLVLAKILTSGYQPLGAVVASADVTAPFEAGGGTPFRHGYTYSGHATACAASLANLDLLAREGLVDRVAQLEPRLPDLIGGLASAEGVEEVRIAGLTAGVQLDAEWLTEEQRTIDEVVVACRQRGVLTRALASGALHFSPPFVVEEGEIARFAEVVADVLEAPARDPDSPHAAEEARR